MISAILSPATAADTGAIRRYQQQQKQPAELSLCSTKGAPRLWRHRGEAIRPTRWDVVNFPPPPSRSLQIEARRWMSDCQQAQLSRNAMGSVRTPALKRGRRVTLYAWLSAEMLLATHRCRSLGPSSDGPSQVDCTTPSPCPTGEFTATGSWIGINTYQKILAFNWICIVTRPGNDTFAVGLCTTDQAQPRRGV